MIRISLTSILTVFALVLALVGPGSLRAQEQQAQPAQGAAAPEGDVSADKPPLIPSRFFASRPIISDAELSPDGSKLSFITQKDGLAQFVLADPATGKTIATQFMPEAYDVVGYTWIDNERLLVYAVGIHREKRYWYRVRKLFVAIPSTNYVAELIGDPLLASSARVLRIDDEENTVIVAHPAKRKQRFPSVYRYDLARPGVGILIQPKIEDVLHWSVDDSGTVRLGQGIVNGEILLWYRPDGSQPFAKRGQIKTTGDGTYFGAVMLKAGSDIGYTITEGENQRLGLYRFDFADQALVETLYANPDWDVDGLWQTEGEPKAAYYTDDVGHVVWLDQENRALYAELKAALGGEVQLTFRSISEDNQRMLIAAGSASDPGVLYFFDKGAMSLKEVTPLRPKLDFRLLAEPKPISFAARDGTEIRGYLTLPKGREPKRLPLVIMPHGGPFGVRDQLRFDDWVQILANRGYAVLQPNYRGSGGYGKTFYELGLGEVGRAMQDDLDDAMDWAVAQGIADPERVCLVGGSYGGYASVWGLIRNPERYRCAASWASVTDWPKMLRYDRKYLTREAQKNWEAKIEGEDEANMAAVSPARLASRLSRPLLLGHGTSDPNVPFTQHEGMMKAAKDAPVKPTELVIRRAGHSFGDADKRKEWLDALDVFLAEHNPADQLDKDGTFRPPVDPELLENFVPLELTTPPASE